MPTTAYSASFAKKVNIANNNPTPSSTTQATRSATHASNPQTQAPHAVASLVLGICSIVFGCFGCQVGIILGIIGIVVAKKGFEAYNANPSNYIGSGMLKAGKITSIIGIIYWIAMIAIYGSYYNIF